MPTPTASRRPIIGITVDNSDEKPWYILPFAYPAAIDRAGGIPLMLPFQSDLSQIPRIVDMLDGILFTGGNDLDPALWNEPGYHPKTTPVHPDRQKYELALMAEVERRRTPTLGICLGSQLMNVHRGGSMKQFIPDLNLPGGLEHRKTGTDENRHNITATPGSLLHKTLGQSEVLANSSHKQCMGRIGKGLNVVATAADGVIEGIEDPTMPLWLAVQWHPERLADKEPYHQALFNLLIERAGGNR